MLKEAVPYDYGGIDIIDELPLPSSKKTDPKKEENGDHASKAQSTVTGEPSLGNVVNAAEDFIKVLATVSTSQSSTASSDRGETQSSEKKKKRKNTGKKKNGKKQKGKGKWKKSRKQKAEASSKADDGTAASTSGGKGEVKGVSTFISETHRHDPSRKHINPEQEPVRKEEPLKEVMKDEPAMDKDTETPTGILHCSTTTVPPQRMKTRRLKQRGRKKTLPFPQEPPLNTTEVSAQTTITTIRVSEPQRQSPEKDADDASTVSPKVKRTRSKESGDREWRKKRRKDSSVSPTVAAPNKNNPADHLKAIPLAEAPTEPSDRSEGRTVVRLNTSYSVLKTQRLKDRGLGSSQRKAVLSAAGKKASRTRDNLISPPPQSSGNSRARVAATSVPTEETQAHTERLSPSTTKAHSVTKNRHRQTLGGQRRSRKRTRPSAVTDGVSVLEQTEQTAATFTSTSPDFAATREPDLQRSGKTSASTSASPVLSPAQLSVERLRAQFIRKKRRKAAMRQQ